MMSNSLPLEWIEITLAKSEKFDEPMAAAHEEKEDAEAQLPRLRI
ncbi:unnamed protein product [Arabidopsis halleri]